MAEQLGTDERGQPVLSMVHHSRNSASKQWDETWVLALNSVTRLFRTFLPLLQQRLPAARFEQACHPSPSPNPSPNPNPDPDPNPSPSPNPNPAHSTGTMMRDRKPYSGCDKNLVSDSVTVRVSLGVGVEGRG